MAMSEKCNFPVYAASRLPGKPNIGYMRAIGG